MSPIPALQAGRTAVITGGASGIGLAAAKRFAAMGLNVLIADTNSEAVAAAPDLVSADAAPNVRVEAGVVDVE